MNLTQNILKTFLPAVAAAALIGGCKSEPLAEGERDGMEFNKSCEVSAVNRIADTQIAIGARTDATLRPYHFNEAELNSLGRQKIDYMLKETGDDSTGKLVVYVDCPAGVGDADKELVKARQGTVSKYLVSLGRAEDSFRLENGFNPNDTVMVTSLKPAATDPAAAAAAPAPAAPAASSGFGSTSAPK